MLFFGVKIICNKLRQLPPFFQSFLSWRLALVLYYNISLYCRCFYPIHDDVRYEFINTVINEVDSDLRPQWIRRMGFSENTVQRNYEEVELSHSLMKEWTGKEG